MDNPSKRKKWHKTAIKLIEEGDTILTISDKVLIRKEVTKFLDDYVYAQGKLPIADYSNILILDNYLSPLGYHMPRVKKWIDEGLVNIHNLNTY
jgi:hypothetical protein